MNRDEFYSRPTTPACWVHTGDGVSLLGGWDQQEGREGGTWLAVDRNGRLGFLTNIYTGGVLDTKATGRGFLVTDWLRSDQTAAEYLQKVSQDSRVFNPFNLVLLEIVDGNYTAWRYTRGKKGHTADFGPQMETEGYFGVGNHPQHEECSYVKSVYGKQRLEQIVRESSLLKPADVVTRLETLMTDRKTHWPDPQIVAQGCCEGTPGPFAKHEEQLSSIYVQVNNTYGTRTTTSVMVDSKGLLTLQETSWQGEGRHQFSFPTQKCN